MGNLSFGIVAGAIDVAYLAYGRRRTKLVPVIAGVLLCIYPYFVESWLWLSVVGGLLLAAPFVIDFQARLETDAYLSLNLDGPSAALRVRLRGAGQLRSLGGMSTATVGEIYNYRQATPDLATSGQPREEQLPAIAAAGYEVVVNLALHEDPRYSLKDEASSVKALGLEYVHIPVQFGAPTEHDLALFFDTMDRCKNRRVWVHCAANMRVTAFLGLYWRLRQGWPEQRAFALMHDVWRPNPVWSTFIATHLAKANAA